MKKNYDFNLIKGTFPGPEILKILTEMINSKIRYHNMENFSSQELFGKDAAHSQKRIKNLKKVQEGLKKFFAMAEKKDVEFKIEGIVSITVIEK